MNTAWEDFFLHRVLLSGDCILWATSASDGVYGVAWFPEEQKALKVHIISYVLAKGAIPSGYDIDHTCERKLCVKPEHLDAVTKLEHKRRHIERHGHYQHNILQCPKGHHYTPENTFSWKDGKRRCVICEKDRRPGWTKPAIQEENYDGDI